MRGSTLEPFGWFPGHARSGMCVSIVVVVVLVDGAAIPAVAFGGAAILAMMGPSSDGALPVRPGEVLVKAGLV